jgi:hypothetical protein
MSQYKQEPVELDNDDDDIRSIAGSEWTVDTSATNKGGNITKKELILKISLLEVGGLRIN